ncbi:hypothetical protein JT358_02915 [Micrococcales bacterium 31B]|nr:hypothetical protein [Micrococcales bacterium 31B]
MPSRTAHRAWFDAASPLAQIMPDAEFGEVHSGIVDAPADRVWSALQVMTWGDLKVGRALLALRGIPSDSPEPWYATFEGAQFAEREPRHWMFATLSKPWHPRPAPSPARSLDQVRDCTAPGWLKMGMEWTLHDLADGRTAVETRTLCAPTDAHARRRFALYWRVVGPLSGVLRQDMIGALRRLAVRP